MRLGRLEVCLHDNDILLLLRPTAGDSATEKPAEGTSQDGGPQGHGVPQGEGGEGELRAALKPWPLHHM